MAEALAKTPSGLWVPIAATEAGLVRAQVEGNPIVVPVAIASGASLSAEINCLGKRIARIIMPAEWTAAAITFKVAQESGGTFQPLFDSDGTEVAIAAAAALINKTISTSGIAVDLSDLLFVKIQSGTNASNVNQTAARTLYLVLA